MVEGDGLTRAWEPNSSCSCGSLVRFFGGCISWPWVFGVNHSVAYGIGWLWVKGILVQDLGLLLEGIPSQ